MLKISLYKYKKKLERINNILLKEEISDLSFKNLIKHVEYFHYNIDDLKINYKNIYEEEMRPVLYNALNVIKRKRSEFRNDGQVKQRNNLIKAMKKYSRWRINELASNNESVKRDLIYILKMRDRGVVSISLYDGEVTYYENLYHASKELGIISGIISKCCRKVKGSKTGTLKVNGQTYIFKYDSVYEENVKNFFLFI